MFAGVSPQPVHPVGWAALVPQTNVLQRRVALARLQDIQQRANAVVHTSPVLLVDPRQQVQLQIQLIAQQQTLLNLQARQQQHVQHLQRQQLASSLAREKDWERPQAAQNPPKQHLSLSSLGLMEGGTREPSQTTHTTQPPTGLLLSCLQAAIDAMADTRALAAKRETPVSSTTSRRDAGAKPKGLNPSAPAFTPTTPRQEPDTEDDETSDEKKSTKGSRTPTTPAPTCHFFMRGTCKQGERCKYSHGHPQTEPTTRSSPGVFSQSGAATPPPHIGMGLHGQGMYEGSHSDSNPRQHKASPLFVPPNQMSMWGVWGAQQPAHMAPLPLPMYLRKTSTPSTPPPADDASSAQQQGTSVDASDVSQYFIPQSLEVAEAYVSIVQPCQQYSNPAQGCMIEKWPHKLSHYFVNQPGLHETDLMCVYPQPRENYRTCQIHRKKMLRWELTMRKWVQVSTAASDKMGGSMAAVREFSILTYNVLFDHYLVDMIQSPKRFHALLEVLREADCDVLCLQEVRSSFLSQLLQEDWVRASYYVSAGTDCTSLAYSGVVILSRVPVLSITIHDLPQTSGNTSPCAVGTLRLASGVDAVLCTAHLNRKDAHVKTAQLANLLRIVESAKRAILIGDFNIDSLRLRDFTDAWEDAHPPPEADAEGALPAAPDRMRRLGDTISLHSNPMAAKMAELYTSPDDAARKKDDDEGGIGFEADVSGRFDSILLKTPPPGGDEVRLSVRPGSTLVGGRGLCREYLVRRLARLCKALGRDAAHEVAAGGVALEPAELAELGDAAPRAQSASVSPYTTEEVLLDRLKQTVDALKHLAPYLCPSDHYYVKTVLEVTHPPLPGS